ncbi:MAG: PUA-like domain-containing protein [Monoraphidium minutum]|nr:MAG: PUA-like domain-containing protein [Monoraphidium minutum]
MKSEPDVFSIDALAAKPNQTEHWDGVRNYVARNHMMGMKLGDRAFFYHSNCKVPGIVGIAKVVREAYPDHTQFDKTSEYYDPKASEDKPRWFMVDIQLERRLERQVSLEELKSHKGGPLAGMALFQQSRLSVQPVAAAEWEFVLGLAARPPPLPRPPAAAVHVVVTSRR